MLLILFEVEFDKIINFDVYLKEIIFLFIFIGIWFVWVVFLIFEEEEVFIEKFFKINCKYIISGKGIVSGVLLVILNNIMFDLYKIDFLV